MKLRSVFTLLIVMPVFAADPPVKLTLVSKDGKSITAEVVAVGKKSAKIKKADGKEYEIAFDRLKPESVEALKKATPPTAPAAPAANKDERPLPKGKPATPADIPEKVVVKAGEKVFVTFTETASGLTKPMVVKEGNKDTPYFTVDFQKRKDGEDISYASLQISYLKTVTIKCLARNKGQTKYYPTSLIPLYKGLPNGESWGDDVEELVFYDFAWSDETID
ncbi:MAG TPA: hypothetical protein VG796_14805 [Verrucomicrobiales bacterium]|nr:hypothetical protein [Verrucomicrobiales bacterium]